MFYNEVGKKSKTEVPQKGLTVPFSKILGVEDVALFHHEVIMFQFHLRRIPRQFNNDDNS